MSNLPTTHKELAARYDALRQKELELLQLRHNADLALQKMRFEIAAVAAELTRNPGQLGDMGNCW